MALARLRVRLPGSVLLTGLGLQAMLAVIADARLFAGTSLHGNIAAMAYGVPHLGLTSRVPKLAAYLATWAAPPLARCREYEDLAQACAEVLALPPAGASCGWRGATWRPWAMPLGCRAAWRGMGDRMAAASRGGHASGDTAVSRRRGKGWVRPSPAATPEDSRCLCRTGIPGDREATQSNGCAGNGVVGSQLAILARRNRPWAFPRAPAPGGRCPFDPAGWFRRVAST